MSMMLITIIVAETKRTLIRIKIHIQKNYITSTAHTTQSTVVDMINQSTGTIANYSNNSEKKPNLQLQ